MATAGIYRRVLPSPPAVEFASPQGKKLFAESVQIGTMEGFFKLISNFQTQSEPAYCGLASISMVLNALAIDPGRKWKGPWRWFDESMLDCCEPLEKVKDKGITFAKVACLAICNGAKVEAFRTNQCTIDVFRQSVIACTSTEDCHVITSYHRKTFKQTGSGHFSPIGGYHAGSDMILILDVARFKYPPHWVPLELLWEAMDTVDEATGLQRGFMVISRPQSPMSMLYTLSCKHDSWTNIAKQLIDDVPVLLRSDDVKDVQKVLSIIFASHTTDFGEFIKWVVEVRREEDNEFSLSKEEKGRLHVKEEILKQVKETKLYKHVVEWLSSNISSCTNFPSIGDKNTSLDTAPCDFNHGAEVLTEKLDLPNKLGNNSRTCVEANGDIPGTRVYGTERGMDMLVPSSETSCCSSSVTTNCIETQQARTDGLTVLLLALPPHIWLGIKDEKLLQQMCSLVSTENLTPWLQEEVLYLRRQLHFLKKCLDDEDAVPSFT